MGYLKLKDAGAHSVGLNNSLRIVSARPEFVIANPLEFTVSGGSASSPQVVRPASGLLSNGAELVFKPSGSNACQLVTAGSVSEENISSTPTVTSDSSKWESQSASYFTHTGAGFRCNTTNTCQRLKDAFDGDFEFQWTAVLGGVGNACNYVGVYLASKDASWADDYTGGMYATAMVGCSWTIYLNTANPQPPYCGNAQDGTWYANCSTGQVWKFKREGATLSLYRNGSLVGAYTTPCVGTVRACFGVYDGGGYYGADSVSYNYTVPNYRYTLSGLSPAQAALPEKVYKIRNDKTKPLMSLATGRADEPLVKETALTLAVSGSYTQLYMPAVPLGAPSPDSWNAQSFQVQTADPITKAKIKTYDSMVGTNFDFFIVNDNGGIPGSTVYAQALNVAGAGAATEMEFTFATPFTPTAGTTYWLKAANHAGGNVPVNSWAYANAGTYAYGQAKVPGSSTPGSGQDFLFGIYQASSPGTTSSQVVVTGPASLLPCFASGNLSRDLIVTVGGTDCVVQPNGTVTETDTLVPVISNTAGTTEHDFASVATTGNWGQQFTAPSAFNLSKVTAKGVVHGAGINRTVTCAIYADSGSDQPTGAALATTSISGWTTSAETDWIFGTPPALAAGAKYWIVWSAALDASNYIGFLHDSSDTLAGGQAKRGDTITSLSWPPGVGYDSYFKVHAAGKTTTIPIPAQASAPTAARLRSRFQTPADIASVAWAAGPELTVTGAETEVSNESARRLALMLRSDVTAVQMRARTAKIYIKEHAA